MNKIILVLVFFLGNLALNAQDLESFFEATDLFMKTNVRSGKVDYKGIQKDQSALNSLLKLAEKIKLSPSEAKEYQAFWINAYNISVIARVIANYPLKSPLDKSGFFDVDKHQLGGQNVTLNFIENELLRAEFKDPRFHFVLVCGAMGCPPLISEAYVPAKLEAQLEKQTKLAINGLYFIKVNTKKKKVEASEILKWYKDDFVSENSSEIDFINRYRLEKIPNSYSLTYFPYNWTLNGN